MAKKLIDGFDFGDGLEHLPKGTCNLFGEDSLMLSGGGAAAAYNIAQSCRFNDDDAADMTQTFAGASDNPDKATVACWLKRGNLGAEAGSTKIFDHGGGWEGLMFNTTDQLNFQFNSANVLVTNAVYRDPGAWMHVAYIVETSQATAADRLKLFVNGLQVTSFASSSYPTINQDAGRLFGSTGNFTVGVEGASSNQFDGYMAQFVGLDGIAAAITDLGEFDTNGTWVPIDLTGLTFGTNGFLLDFAIAPGTGNGAGEDVSGNANHFTESGLAANDQVSDSPTDDAASDVGNYCVLNVLENTSGLVFSNGNLSLTYGPANWRGTRGTIKIPDTGKWYFEAVVTDAGGLACQIGVVTAAADITDQGAAFEGWYAWWGQSGSPLVFNNDAGTAYGTAPTTGQTVMVAVDRDNDEVYFGVNGTWQNSSVPDTNTSPAISSLPVDVWPAITVQAGLVADVNFGQQTFNYPIGAGNDTEGFKALHTANLPAPTITDPSKYFQVDTFTGTGAELARTLTDAAGAAVSPDMVWIKDRDTAVEHVLTDSARGATIEQNPDSTLAETTVAQGLKSFDASGYTLGTDGNYNTSSSANVAWAWVEGVTQGFDMVLYTGNGANRTIAHSLGVTPEFMIIKDRDAAKGWGVYHKGLTDATYFLDIQTNTAQAVRADYWNSTAPTSSVFSLGTAGDVNTSSDAFINYLFAGVEGFSKFGSYEGEGNADGTFVPCGFRPRWIMCKSIDSTSSWYIYDTARDGYNVDNDALLADTTGAELTADNIDILSNGFKLRIATDPNVAETYIFAAFAEFPFGGVGVSQARAR